LGLGPAVDRDECGYPLLGLGLVIEQVDRILNKLKDHRRFTSPFALVRGFTVAAATVLHGIEAGAWGLAYQLLGALPNNKAAMLYSLGAMTTYGNSDTSLPNQWRMMGALEALNRMLLFGLTAPRLGLCQNCIAIELRRD
jgi:hypothetical protein